jgi:tRNA threonylcarbamoyladenosine biosynthesis protein TsaB
MKVLAVDTSSRCGAIGLCVDGEVVGEVALRSQETHSARLLPSIDWLLRSLGLGPDDIDAFGVVTGPGSFTGLRVGLATIKGLAFGSNKSVTALHSLEVLAHPFAGTSQIIAPLLDARRGRVYGAAYRWHHEKLETIRPPADTEVPPFLEGLKEEILFLGEGARKFEKECREMVPLARFAASSFDIPRGGVLAEIAYQRIQNGDTVAISKLEPIYL